MDRHGNFCVGWDDRGRCKGAHAGVEGDKGKVCYFLSYVRRTS
jgi:hypothetical protein